METSFPGHITTVDQEEPPRQMGRGEDRESSRTISAAFPPRSGFVQQGHEPERRTASLRSLFGTRRASRAGARLTATLHEPGSAGGASATPVVM